MHRTFLAILFLVATALTAQADIDPQASTWTIEASPPAYPLTFFPVRDGSGPPLSACFGYGIGGCVPVAASITVTLIDDATQAPMAGVSRELVRIGQEDGLAWCPGLPVPNCADADSDADGQLRFTQAYRGSGWATAVHIWVWSHGAWHALAGALPFHSVSVDLNNDGLINLSDMTVFSACYHGPYDARIDYCHDGLYRVSDITFLAMGYYPSCE